MLLFATVGCGSGGGSGDETSSGASSGVGTTAPSNTGTGASGTGTGGDDPTAAPSSTIGDASSGGSDTGTDDGPPVFDGCDDLGSAHELRALGHWSTPTIVAVTPERVLAWEDGARWILWDVASASIVARGSGRVVGRGGDRFMVDAVGEVYEDGAPQTSFELRSLADGSRLAEVEALHRHGGVAEDGSYAWTHDLHTLELWEMDGSSRASIAGIDDGHRALALPDVWLGPDDAGILHRVDVDTGEVELASFVGTFAAYFADRSHYVTAGSGLVAIYPMAGGDAVAVHELPAGTRLGGSAGHLWRWWTVGGLLDVFDMHDVASPILSLSNVGGNALLSSGDVLALTDLGAATLTLVDLSDDTPVARTIPAPRERFESFGVGDGIFAVAAARGALWSVQTDAFTPLGGGQLLGLSGADNGWIAAAFEVEGLRVLDAVDGSEVVAVDADVSKVVMRNDGLAVAVIDSTLLATDAREVRVHALPGGDVTHTLASDDPADHLRDFEMSADGSHVVRTFVGPSGHVELTALADGAVIYDGASPQQERLALSPSGHALTRSSGASTEPAVDPVTRFIVDGALTNAVDGVTLAFVDDARLLFDAGGASLELREADGSSLGTTPIPGEVDHAIALGDGRVYAVETHRLYDLAGGEVDWPDAPPSTASIAGVAGAFVVHTTCARTRLVATPLVAKRPEGGGSGASSP